MCEKSFIHRIAKVFIDILFYLSIVCTALVPFFTDDFFKIINYTTEGIILLTVILFLSGICCIYILYNLKKMYKSLLDGNPFAEENVKHFRKIAVSCALIAVIYIIKCFLIFTFGTLVVTAVFSVGCLFCLTLKDLFKQAINYKTENDLTV